MRLDQATIEIWKNKDLWSEKELQELCCGLRPNEARPNTDELNQAVEAIKRAILSKKLPCICPSDATQADRLYGHARFFTPADAIKWAAPRFSEFPFMANSQEAQLLKRSDSEESGQSERKKLLKHVAVLALVLAERVSLYKRGDKPNASQIAEAVKGILESLPDANGHGAGASSIRESISAGIELLNE